MRTSLNPDLNGIQLENLKKAFEEKFPVGDSRLRSERYCQNFFKTFSTTDDFSADREGR